MRQGVTAPHNRRRAAKFPPATKLLVFTPKGSTVWAGNFHGTHDAVTITLLFPWGGVSPKREVLCKSGRLRTGLRLGRTIALCLRVHDTVPRPAQRLAEPSFPRWGEGSVENGSYAFRQAQVLHLHSHYRASFGRGCADPRWSRVPESAEGWHGVCGRQFYCLGRGAAAQYALPD